MSRKLADLERRPAQRGRFWKGFFKVARFHLVQDVSCINLDLLVIQTLSCVEHLSAPAGMWPGYIMLHLTFVSTAAGLTLEAVEGLLVEKSKLSETVQHRESSSNAQETSNSLYHQWGKQEKTKLNGLHWRAHLCRLQHSPNLLLDQSTRYCKQIWIFLYKHSESQHLCLEASQKQLVLNAVLRETEDLKAQLQQQKSAIAQTEVSLLSWKWAAVHADLWLYMSH